MNRHLKKSKTKGSKRRNVWVFVLGGLFGVVIAGMFAKQNDMIDLAWMEGVNLDTFKDVLPASLINDVREYQVCSILRAAWEKGVELTIERNTRRVLLVMTPLPLGYMHSRKASRRTIPSL